MPSAVFDSSVIDDRWIVAKRGPRHAVDPRKPYAHLVEKELTIDGTVEDVGTIFLTNKECPFKCLMCDLWKNTTTATVPAGAVTDQIAWALSRMPGVQHLKLYNSGNFFDRAAIPPEELPEIARLVGEMRTVIVECHPRLVDARCEAFQEMLRPSLHVAMGLETADPDALSRLNKRMTLDDFERATRFLVARDIAVRTFILLPSPFHRGVGGVAWAKRSLEWAFSVGVECCAVVPTRVGNGAMEWLADQGQFAPPTLADLENVVEHGVALRRGRVLADLWDIQRFATCSTCCERRIARLGAMNLTQSVSPRVTCDCEAAA